jgi:hypothetical protein
MHGAGDKLKLWLVGNKKRHTTEPEPEATAGD